MQIGQMEGGASVAENCVPQVTQMKGVVTASVLHSSQLYEVHYNVPDACHLPTAGFALDEINEKWLF
jgi:hypothetical protein